ncbi:MAG: PorV/PorQ family protein [candidate division KSB1 bacterium]|nr:PorV/PorQ family protein [candidate division KSB1 bacterium]
MKIKFYFAVLILLLFTWSLSAQTPRDPMAGIDPPDFNRVGQTGWQFLHLPTTARTAAMADVKSGLIHNDASAIFNNPANMAEVENLDASFTQINYIADISYMTAALAKNFGAWGNFGVFFANLDIGEMVRTQNVYNEFLGSTERSGDLGTFTAGDVMIGLAYARNVTDRLSIGGNVSYIEENLADTEVKNWNTDFGLYYRTGFKSLRLSMVARNFGPDTEFAGFNELYGVPQSVRMPINFRLGIGFDPIPASEDNPHELSVYLEGVHPNDGPERVHAALEYKLMKVLSIRGGYKFNYDEQGLTLGGGVHFYMGGMSGRIDYAYLDYGRLDTVHMFSVGFAMD